MGAMKCLVSGTLVEMETGLVSLAVLVFVMDFSVNSNPVPLQLLQYELLQASLLQLGYSPSKCELALASGHLRAQACPAHRGLQKLSINLSNDLKKIYMDDSVKR